jgi:cell division protein FtsW
MYYVVRQALFSIAGFAGMLFVAKIDYHYFSKFAWFVYWLSFFLMALVRFTPLGKEVNHAKRWLRMPFGFTIQPSELAKIAVVVLIPFLICKVGKHFKAMKVPGKIFLWGAAIAGGVYLLTDNLSTAIIVLGIVCVMIFVAHKKTAPFLLLAGGGLSVVGIFVYLLDSMMDTSESFRLRRILVWLHPEEYMSDGGYQVMQGLYAIGSGGFFGKGLGNSAQKMVIPEAQNDMILAVICEELGVFGAIVLLTMFGILLYRLMFIAQNAPDQYGALMVTGIFAHIALQVILNVAVVLNVIPTTGITLPFVSYGGTSMVFLLVEMGIALSVSNRIEFDVQEEK